MTIFLLFGRCLPMLSKVISLKCFISAGKFQRSSFFFPISLFLPMAEMIEIMMLVSRFDLDILFKLLFQMEFCHNFDNLKVLYLQISNQKWISNFLFRFLVTNIFLDHERVVLWLHLYDFQKHEHLPRIPQVYLL